MLHPAAIDYGKAQTSEQSAPAPAPAPERIHFSTRIENACRQWGLSSLYILIVESFRPFLTDTYFFVKEHGRVAIFQDHLAAALAALLHLPPIAGTVVITWFVCHEYYIGGKLSDPSGYDKEKFLGLQFAAKLHELFMLASLTAIVFTAVRHELALGEGVPFGSLTAGLEIDKISFFWSKEFWAIILGNFSTVWKKMFFIALIILCTLLGVSVAPASATALQPILDHWPAGGTDIWLNSTAEQMFPSILNDSHTLGSVCATSDSNNECPSAQWQTLAGEYLLQLPGEDISVNGLVRRSPVGLNIRGRNSVLNLLVDVRAPVFDTFIHNFSVAFAPHVAVADAMVLNTNFWDLAARNSTAHGEYRFFYRSGEQFSMPAPGALSFARCQATTFKTSSSIVPVFPDIRDINCPSITINDTSVTDWIASGATNNSRPELFWFDPPADFANTASLGAVISMPIASVDPSVQIWGCMIDARWANASFGADRLSFVASGTPDNFHEGWIFQNEHPRATIQPSFAQYLNPQLPSINSTAFQEMVISTSLWNPDTLQGSGIAPHLEAVLNVMIVNGMARTAPYTTQQGNIIDFDNGNGSWWRGFMPVPPQEFGPGGNAYDVTPDEQKSFYRLHIQAFATGYAYSRKNSASWFSIIILLVYVAVATLFVVVSVVFGVTSSSWQSATELMALALASPAPKNMANTAAGISTIQTFRDRYYVLADADHLELAPWQGKLPPEKRVHPNVVYG